MNRPSPLELAVMDALTLMGEMLANPKPVTPELVRGWTLVLSSANVKAEEISEGVGRLLQSQTFFPTPADFLKALRPPEDADCNAELAWQRTLNAVRRFGGNASLHVSDFEGDGAVVWTIDRAGWSRLCEGLTVDNRQFYRAEFIRIYRLAVREKASLDYIAGRFELANTAQNRELPPPLPALEGRRPRMYVAGKLSAGTSCGRPDWETLPQRREALPPPSRELLRLTEFKPEEAPLRVVDFEEDLLAIAAALNGGAR